VQSRGGSGAGGGEDDDYSGEEGGDRSLQVRAGGA
jgi:hypothetical protein